MTAIFWLPTLVRALATAALVVSASAAAEAVGPFWAALIASLPVSAGPVYVFLAMQHGEDFVAASALSSFVANASTGVFLIIYGRLAGSTPPWRSMGIAILGWLTASLVTRVFIWTPLTALLLNFFVYGAGFVLPDVVRGAQLVAARLTSRGRLGLAARALAVASFVSIVVTASDFLGPDASGILAVFPVSLISLIVIVRPRIGGLASSLLAADALQAMLGFGVMLLALHLAIRPLGVPGAFAVALATSALWSSALLFLRRGKQRT